MPEQECGITECPTCSKPLAIVFSESEEWQYLCPACGKSFRFELKKDDDLGE